jgi:hypothetical protein
MRRLAAILVAVAVVIIGVIIGAGIYLRAQFNEAYRLAFEAHRHSRSHPEWPMVGYDFVTRGIRCGASEQEVDAIIHDATETSRLVQMDGGNFAKLYYVVYQPRFLPPFSTESQPIVTEKFFVWFRPSDGAYRLERTITVTGHSSQSGTTTWDLCTKQRISDWQSSNAN